MISATDRLRIYLAEFQQLEKKFPGPIPDSIRIGSPSIGCPQLLVSFMVHGDEVGPLPAILRFIEQYTGDFVAFNGEITFVLGNKKAALAGQRFTEQDLNRVFLKEAPDSFEKTRAQAIMSLFKGMDLLLDLHQTIEPCEKSFYIFAFDKATYYWARALEATDVLVTRKAAGFFATGCLCIDEYGVKLGIPSITIEVGQKGFAPEAEARTFQVLQKALGILNSKKNFRDISVLEQIANSAPPLKLYKRVDSLPFRDAEMRLEGHLKNFQALSKGERIGVAAGGAPLLAPRTGFVLFPKYPPRDAQGLALSPLPSDLYLILEEAGIHEFL